jgi:PAS domain S-box-containing protein
LCPAPTLHIVAGLTGRLRNERVVPAVNIKPRPRIAIFPPDDAAFAALVRRRESENLGASPSEVAQAIRAWYPNAEVVAQSRLAAFGDPIWYAYRDGQLRSRDEDSWWEEPGTAWLAFDAEGIFRDANEAAAALVGMTPAELIGKRWSDLVEPAIAEDDPDWLWEALRTTGVVQSVFRLPDRFGTDRWVEYRTLTTDDPNRLTSHWRELHLDR